MNIKGVVGNLIPIDMLRKPESRKKAAQTQDRDPGQGEGHGGSEPEQHRFTDQELQEVLSILKENPGIKTNNLQLRVERNQGRVVVFVEDPQGKIIRRIADTELWVIYKSKSQSSRGTLLNKAL